MRADRLNGKNVLEKKAARGSFIAKHEKNSEINFITAMDSKPVSILSTVAGVTPLHNVKRYSNENHCKSELPFPAIFSLYNRFMG